MCWHNTALQGIAGWITQLAILARGVQETALQQQIIKAGTLVWAETKRA
jgi:hypothetical protein